MLNKDINGAACKVTVRSRGEGWQDEKITDGEYCFDGETAVLKYKLDEDDCLLTSDGKAVFQTREGAQNISLSFRKGERTQCTFGTGELSGSFEIFTDEIKFDSVDGGFKLFLEYTGGGGKIKLSLTAEKIGG